MFPKTLLSFSLGYLALFGGIQIAAGQITPAAVVITSGAPGEHFIFRCEGTYSEGAAFGYLNYNSGEIDSFILTVQPNGAFSGTSQITGRAVSGAVSGSTVSFTYKGVTHSAPKSSSYGPTAAFAGVWAGAVIDSTTGIGYGQAVITSQGQIFVIAGQNFFLNEGFGTIDAGGNFSVPLLDGTTVSGVFSPSNGRAIGSFNLSTGGTQSAALVRGVPARLLNISTRGFVGSGEQVIIGGFIIGDGGKTVLINAKGPSLAAAGVANPVQATQINLYLGNQLIASNNGWRNNANASEIASSGLAPTDDRESALQVALEPGAYTAIVSSGDGSTGIGLVEVYGVGDTEGP